MKRIYISIFLSFLLTSIYSQNTNTKDYHHQLGLNAGFCTGIGPTYKYWPGKFGVQLSLLPIKVSKEWKDILHVQDIVRMYVPYDTISKFVSAGLTGIMTLKQYKSYKLISYLGNHLIMVKDYESYNIGGGVGISFDKLVSFNLMLGYGAYDVLNSLDLYPTAEVGIMVRLKKKNKK